MSTREPVTPAAGGRLVDVLAPLGLLVMFGAWAWQASGRVLPGQLEWWLAGGSVLVVAHLVARWDAVASRIGRRQLAYGGNTVALTVLVLGIVVGLNWLSYRHSKRWDLTKNQRYSLSDQAKKVLGGLQEDVQVVYFQRKAEMPAAEQRMKLFAEASPRLRVEWVDPLVDPVKAQEYGARGPWPVIVFERGAKRERITGDGEQELVNALIKVTRDEVKTVCFVQGEGERDIEDAGDRGFTAVKEALGESQYQTRSVVLLREPDVPAECTVVVVAGPEKDLLPTAADALRRYVRQGGKALVMTEPPLAGTTPNLTALIGEWGIETANDIVLDVSPVSQFYGTGPLTPLTAQYPPHEITRDFRLATAFHTARSVRAAPGAEVAAQNLAETSPASWAETDLALNDPVEMDPAVDREGPVSLAAAVTIPVASPEPAASPEPTAASPAPSPAASPAAEDGDEGPATPTREARVVVIGDSDFATNAMLPSFPGNRDFVLNAVAWLAEDADLISIRPREPEDQRLFLTAQQQRNVALFTLLLLPLTFVVLGVASWWRRR